MTIPENSLNVPGWDPSAKQFNSLFKCRWLFDQLVQSPSLAEAGPTSLWARLLEDLKEVG